MIHLAFFLYYFAQKTSKRPHLLEEIRLNQYFYLFSTRSPSCLWSLNSRSTIAHAWIVFTFFSLKKQKTKFQHWITKNLTDFIIAVTGIRIKSELAEVVLLRTYSCFESLKVRDYRLEPVPRYSFYKRIRKDSQ